MPSSDASAQSQPASPAVSARVQSCGAGGDVEDRLHPRAAQQRLRRRALGHEPRRERAPKAGSQSGNALVARWPEDRLRRQLADRRQRHLRHERRRERRTDQDSRARCPAGATAEPTGRAVPTWSPDGRTIAFTRSYCDRRYSEIYVMNADGSEQRMLARNAKPDYGIAELAWSPRGDKIAFVSPARRQPGDLPRECRRRRAVEADAQHGARQQPRLVAGRAEDRLRSNWQLWVMNADGSGQRRLTRNGARNFASVWWTGGVRLRAPDRKSAIHRLV